MFWKADKEEIVPGRTFLIHIIKIYLYNMNSYTLVQKLYLNYESQTH